MSDGTDIESSGKAFDGGVPIQLSEMLDKLLANPQILSSVASALASSQGQTAQAPPENAVQTSVRQDPSLDAVADKLPEIMNMLRPMISPSVSSSKSDGGGKKPRRPCGLRKTTDRKNHFACTTTERVGDPAGQPARTGGLGQTNRPDGTVAGRL